MFGSGGPAERTGENYFPQKSFRSMIPKPMAGIQGTGVPARGPYRRPGEFRQGPPGPLTGPQGFMLRPQGALNRVHGAGALTRAPGVRFGPQGALLRAPGSPVRHNGACRASGTLFMTPGSPRGPFRAPGASMVILGPVCFVLVARRRRIRMSQNCVFLFPPGTLSSV